MHDNSTLAIDTAKRIGFEMSALAIKKSHPSQARRRTKAIYLAWVVQFHTQTELGRQLNLIKHTRSRQSLFFQKW
jgi:hypothetical protein